MEIRWANIVALALLVCALVILLSHPEKIGSFLGSMRAIAPGHSTEEQAMGLIATGLILVAIVGVVRILAQLHHKD